MSSYLLRSSITDRLIDQFCDEHQQCIRSISRQKSAVYFLMVVSFPRYTPEGMAEDEKDVMPAVFILRTS